MGRGGAGCGGTDLWQRGRANRDAALRRQRRRRHCRQVTLIAGIVGDWARPVARTGDSACLVGPRREDYAACLAGA